MHVSEIEALLRDALALTEVHVKGDGSHYQVIAVSDMFDGMSRVKKQQAIYAPLMDKIAANEIHALSIKAFTEAEWKRERKFLLPS
ncbi:Acid stress-induced BolA-like protein IbaG/YrbA, predicted regulator of iron metabolism [Aeromonas sp. RU39B]|jgi:acid stress-induced BolA-like protein IbaG/YrbA|uniref:BolA family iron metabolism protein IbaG n=1 Tax=Aeromonas sp. RU39B TaxID=1907416 RepID=UPI0009565A89|nr:BolA family iron metabolism protein IbaG [Aeromonas sp. RU39B]SIQ48186.1 Acid stress-induced BolA-like protein IbaG/YrbA, predicted regulator of iron metabolism [Aeromonas sp. RU39B]